VLSATGLYIGFPFIYALKENELIMSHIRFVHFVAAYVFMVNFFIRIYWLFLGNSYAHWRAMVPITKKQWKSIVDQVLFYLFLRKAPPHTVGHTGVAALSYLIIFILFFIEMLTGFALYSQSHYSTTMLLMGGWLLNIMSVQTVRLYHHLIMWALIILSMLHVYLAWVVDATERNGLMGSIFGGYKFVTKREL
jgi:Ni/Fe-hydrogenase 1 B-type cytochrome subunit